MDMTTGTRPGLPGPAAAPASPLPRPSLRDRAPWAGIALIAAAAVAVEMAVSARYGYVRDELYFLSAGQHLAFGYVDQPPLTPLLARITAALTGNTLVGLRILPALALGALVVMTAAMSRRLGAGRTGQLLAALAAATCAEYLGAMHELTTTTPDFVFWAVTLLLVMRLLASQDRRWWLAIGGCVGVASEAKWNIGFLVAALAAGFLLTDARRLLRSRYLLIGGLIAGVLAAPDVIWQAAHGWPALDVFRALQTAAGHNRAGYWPGQILYTGVVLTPVWVAGAVWSLRSAAARPFRPVAIACVMVIALQFVLGGKAYYPGAAFTFLLAAGCVPLERRLAARTPRARRITPAILAAAAMVAGAVAAAPVALSVLPARALHTVPLQKINYDLAETIAWPKLVALVAREYDAVPAAQRHADHDPGRQLRRGGSDRPLWPRRRPAAGLQRRQQLLALGPAARRRLRGYRGERRPGPAPPRVRPRPPGRHVLERARCRRRRAGSASLLATGLKSSWTQAWPAFRDYA